MWLNRLGLFAPALLAMLTSAVLSCGSGTPSGSDPSTVYVDGEPVNVSKGAVRAAQDDNRARSTTARSGSGVPQQAVGYEPDRYANIVARGDLAIDEEQTFSFTPTSTEWALVFHYPRNSQFSVTVNKTDGTREYHDLLTAGNLLSFSSTCTGAESRRIALKALSGSGRWWAEDVSSLDADTRVRKAAAARY